jgi:23S rRNA (adenine2030-N6)-methyltransferase
MNYRHHYHAGNFADVFKHVWLTRLLIYLKRKDAAFRYLDTHAGAGRYDLTAEPAERTGEWRDGIGLLAQAALPGACRELLAPFLALAAPGPNAAPRSYPGSPVIAQALLRTQDRMTLCELHPRDFLALRRRLGGDPRAGVVNIDGYAALNAYVPPKERRGLVLIDPPFENADEFARLTRALCAAYAKWPGGVYAAWYPIKPGGGSDRLASAIAAAGIARALRIEMRRAPLGRKPDGAPLNGCGLLTLNPPYVLADECAVIMPELIRIFGPEGAGAWRIFD